MLALAIALHVVVLGAKDGESGAGLPSSAMPVACTPRPEPPSNGRIEGTIVFRDGSPRSGVRVRVASSKPDREYTALSGADGKYTLSDLPTARELDLAFIAGDKGPCTWCGLRLKPEHPTTTVNVVLDQPANPPQGGGGVGDAVGCAGLPSWMSSGPVQFLTRTESGALFPVEEPSAQLNLRARDIETVSWSRDGAVVRLSSSATDAVRAFEKANVGRMVLFTVESIPAVKTTIPGPLPSEDEFSGEDEKVAWERRSGVEFYVAADKLPGRLCEVLRTRPVVTPIVTPDTALDRNR